MARSKLSNVIRPTRCTPREAAGQEFATCYKEHAAAAQALREAEQALKLAQEQLEQFWEPGAAEWVTALGTIVRAEKRSFELTAQPEQLIQFAQKHGLSTTAPKPASVAPATIRAAALRGIDVSSVAAETVSHVYSLN